MLTEENQDASSETQGATERRPAVAASDADGRLLLTLTGAWTTRTVAEVDDQMRELEAKSSASSVTINLSSLAGLDTAGAWVIERFATVARNAGAAVEFAGQTSETKILLDAVREAAENPEAPSGGKRQWGVYPFLEALGKGVIAARGEFILAMHILGATVRGAQMKTGRGHGLSPAAIVSQMDRMGVGALPVVMLMSGIIGAIIAQQGAFQLRYFGAEIFVVDLVSILTLREIGVLLTAIMVAGRSGSAITAEIGSMKMREEVDALTVIGLNPVGVLVFPRLVALVLVLPCLTIAANAAALGGAMLTAWGYSGITPEAFIDRMHASVDLSSVFSGLIKAPFMAMIIGIVAAVEGLKVEGSAESLGRRVTSSVVKAIFMVIVVDGLFAMFYGAIDY